MELDPDIELIKESPFENTDVYKFEFNKKNFEPKPKKDDKKDKEEEEDYQSNENNNNNDN